MQDMIRWLKGILFLKIDTYEEIGANKSLLVPAIVIAVVAPLIGGVFSGVVNEAIVQTTIGSVIGIALMIVLTWIVGKILFGVKADFKKLVRVLGFAQTPAIIPIIGVVWALVTTFVGLRHVMDLDDTKTAVVLVIGFIPFGIIMWALGLSNIG